LLRLRHVSRGLSDHKKTPTRCRVRVAGFSFPASYELQRPIRGLMPGKPKVAKIEAVGRAHVDTSI